MNLLLSLIEVARQHFMYIPFRLRVADAQRRKRIAENELSDGYEKSRYKAKYESKTDFEETKMCEISYFDDEIKADTSAHLICVAEYYLIQLPSFDKIDGVFVNWVYSARTGRMYMTDSASLSLRKSIREEAKNRRDEWTWIIPLFSGMVGVVLGRLL